MYNVLLGVNTWNDHDLICFDNNYLVKFFWNNFFFYLESDKQNKLQQTYQ